MKLDKRFYDRSGLNDYFIILDRVSECTLGRMINMSADGMKMLAENPVQVPIVAKCRMELPRPVQGCLNWEFEIETRWCERQKLSGLYEVGSKFINLTEDGKKLLHSILATWSSDDSVSSESSSIRVLPNK